MYNSDTMKPNHHNLIAHLAPVSLVFTLCSHLVSCASEESTATEHSAYFVFDSRVAATGVFDCNTDGERIPCDSIELTISGSFPADEIVGTVNVGTFEIEIYDQEGPRTSVLDYTFTRNQDNVETRNFSAAEFVEVRYTPSAEEAERVLNGGSPATIEVEGAWEF